MNVAGALARSIIDGRLNRDTAAERLFEVVETHPGWVAGDPRGVFAMVFRDGLIGRVLSRFEENELFAQLVNPVALTKFLDAGRAGLPMFSAEELDSFLGEVPDDDPGDARQSWLEFAPLAGHAIDEAPWVAYPQTSSISLEFSVILPVRQGTGRTRLLPLDTGLSVTGQATRAPRVGHGSGCDPGVIGTGLNMHQACVPSTCAHDCKASWEIAKGDKRLSGCRC